MKLLVNNYYKSGWLLLHGSSDPSVIAYGACVYLKSAIESGQALKPRTIPSKKKFNKPKMELLRNFILSNLINVVYNALSEEIVVANYFSWSDSHIALAWIKNANEEYKVFVQNWAI